MKVKVLGVQLCQLFATPWTVAPRLLCPWDSPGKNMSGGLAIPFSRGSSQPRDLTRVSHLAREADFRMVGQKCSC